MYIYTDTEAVKRAKIVGAGLNFLGAITPNKCQRYKNTKMLGVRYKFIGATIEFS